MIIEDEAADAPREHVPCHVPCHVPVRTVGPAQVLRLFRDRDGREAGDVLVRDAALPAGLRPGDLLAVPAAGAYQLSMASAYNLAGRPAVAAVRDGRIRLLIRRETVEDFRAREVGR